MPYRFTISLLITMALLLSGMTAWGADAPIAGSGQVPASPDPAPGAPAADVAPAKREDEVQSATKGEPRPFDPERDVPEGVRQFEAEKAAHALTTADLERVTAERNEARAAIATLRDQLDAEKAAHDATRLTLASTAKCANDSVQDVLALRQALLTGQKPGGTIVH